MIWLYIAIAVGVLLTVYAFFVEPELLLIRRVRVEDRRVMTAERPLRIALLSDFHYPRFITARIIRRAIEKSNRFDPDLVFVLGDHFDKNRWDPKVLPKDVGTVFGGIHSRLGVFGVLGNHDHWFDAPGIRALLHAETDIELVDNRAVLVETTIGSIYVVGIGDATSKDVHYDVAVRDLPEDARIILLSHNPDPVEAISDPRIVIQFSGHTHGGQVWIPFLGSPWTPSKYGDRYRKGLSRRGNHLLYVNSGICSARHIRFMCPPEVTWVEIAPTPQPPPSGVHVAHEQPREGTKG